MSNEYFRFCFLVMILVSLPMMWIVGVMAMDVLDTTFSHAWPRPVCCLLEFPGGVLREGQCHVLVLFGNC